MWASLFLKRPELHTIILEAHIKICTEKSTPAKNSPKKMWAKKHVGLFQLQKLSADFYVSFKRFGQIFMWGAIFWPFEKGCAWRVWFLFWAWKLPNLDALGIVWKVVDNWILFLFLFYCQNRSSISCMKRSFNFLLRALSTPLTRPAPFSSSSSLSATLSSMVHVTFRAIVR